MGLIFAFLNETYNIKPLCSSSSTGLSVLDIEKMWYRKKREYEEKALRTRLFFNWQKFPGKCCFTKGQFFIRISNNFVDQLYLIFNVKLGSSSTAGKLKFLGQTLW